MDKFQDFLPLIIIMVLYGLSGFFKGRKKPTGTAGRSPRPAQPPSSKRMPSYARKQEEVSKGPVGIPQQPRPVTQEVGRPKSTGIEIRTDRVKGIPTSSSTSKPKQPGMVPRSMGDGRIRESKQVSRTSGQIPAMAQASRPRVTREAVRRVSTGRKQPEAVRRTAARSAREAVQREQVKASSRPMTVFDHFEKRLSGQSTLAQAILHAEILGKCMALRPSGSHDFSSSV
ncbi:MAG: hypothetical protein IID32_01090 [Planctomycetes bacterium]|nr:hypothetical protein [Planctomycetota bacterium]